MAAGALLAAICVLAVRIRVPEHGAVLAGALFVLHFALGLTDGLVRRRLFRIVVFAVFLFLAQLLLVRGQSVEARMASGMLMSLRFVNIVMASSLFVAATDPESLAYALMQAGLPYRYGYALVAALRFVPYLQEETATVLAAQAARGIGVDRPSLPGVYLRARYTFIPVTVAALSRVDSLAMSMEGRCFGLHAKRTFRRRIPFTAADFLMLTLAIVLSALIVLN